VTVLPTAEAIIMLFRKLSTNCFCQMDVEGVEFQGEVGCHLRLLVALGILLSLNDPPTPPPRAYGAWQAKCVTDVSAPWLNQRFPHHGGGP